MSYQLATVLQRNEVLYVSYKSGQTPTIGKSIAIQTALDNVEVMGEYWATPRMTDNLGIPNGIMRGYYFTPTLLAAPSNFSFKVVRIKDKLTGNTDHIMVTLANYLAGTLTATTSILPIPEHSVCPDASGNLTYEFSLPYKTGGQNYFANVAANGVIQTVSAACASLAALVTWLNANLAALGTWSADNTGNTGKLKLVNALTTTTIGCVITVA